MTQVVITGANRGIGLALTKLYLDAGCDVAACCRTPDEATALHAMMEIHEGLELFELDISANDAIASLGDALAERPIHRLINNAGYYGPKGVMLGNTPQDEWQALFAINCIGPLKLVEALTEGLCQGQGIIANLTSKMGSMTDNSSGGAYLYRSAKAAQNAVTRSLAIDLAPHGVKAVALHPGWVKTAMGGPNALIDTETSAAGLYRVIEELTSAQSGGFFDYQGNKIPW
ncbi:SDR family oxidoreductase [Shewanella litorisediminis]|uniref:SDR family oxidoreductase n=1 Tax=Shewanella litorisediminis TaxID=1173586 RepID=A0ABX7G7K2_9GAMM|nr:SDR family oxidoreductase [Shewanella litorisediminis]MCL2919751.1 SDR family oxidoreductase [Shewanella litorisediminis]QRH03306.1 SDR family oxidoreductase [Shewanella litorisediminis]